CRAECSSKLTFMDILDAGGWRRAWRRSTPRRAAGRSSVAPARVAFFQEGVDALERVLGLEQSDEGLAFSCGEGIRQPTAGPVDQWLDGAYRDRALLGDACGEQQGVPPRLARFDHLFDQA